MPPFTNDLLLLDEDSFIQAQSRLPMESRKAVRSAPEIVKRYFNLSTLPEAPLEYYYWDNTTLCLRKPLVEYVKNGAGVLEIGPGPAATLSLYIRKQKSGLHSSCAEINPDFILTAREMIALNHEEVDIFQSDMTQNVKGQFDVIFMNPPYVKPEGLKELNIDRSSHEGKAGYGGEDGSTVVQKFLQEVPRVLKKDGMALLGVNTRHLEDETVLEKIRESDLELVKKFYPLEKVFPNGPYSQVYVLSHGAERNG